MKIQLLRDASGKVIASSEVSNKKELSVTPQADKGLSLEEVDSSENYAKDLGAFYKQHEKPGK